MNKFRPQNLNKLYLLKHARVTGRRENYNWQTRIEWWPCGYRLNKITIAKQFKQLHYLACHAPDPIRKRWANAYKLFEAKHFASRGNASIRYLNTYTAHAWM